MATRASTRSNRGSSKLRALDQSNRPGPSASSKKRSSKKAAAGIFPLLDDETARIALSYLPSACFGDSALVSKAWETLISKDDLWRPFLATVDPMSAIGEDRLQAMSLQYSSKQVVSELSTRLCSCCREPTNGFFVLTCTRLCRSCFQTDPSVKMSSLSFARSHYLLSKSQEKTLPTLRVQNHKETGCVGASNDSAVTLTLIRAAKASAVNRWGSEEAFEGEMSARKAKAEAAYEARKQAFNNRDRAAAGGSAGSPVPQGEGGGEHQVADKPRRFPSRPRILGLGNETNFVGENQQETHVVGGEKYGFYTVVNDDYFDSGPTVVITEDGPESYSALDVACDEREPDDVRWAEFDLASEEHHGRKLVEALRTAKHGTTIEITASCSSPTSGIMIDTSVRLIGAHNRHIRSWNGPTLVLRAPTIMRDVKVKYDLPPTMSEDDIDRTIPYDIRYPSVILGDDALVERCRMGQDNGQNMGYCLLVKVGRLVARKNIFVGGLCGIAVDPPADIIDTTTVHLERNTFSGFYDPWGWGSGTHGLCKGPAYCHLAQDNAAVLAANTFRGISEQDQIREHNAW